MPDANILQCAGPKATNLTTPMIEALVEIAAKSRESGPIAGVHRSDLECNGNTIQALEDRRLIVWMPERAQVSSFGRLVLNAYFYGGVRR